MSKILPIFRGSLGLNNKIDPHRIKYSAKTGVQQQAELIDCDVDESMRINRRKGNARVVSLPAGAHSLWGDGRDCFFVTGSQLRRLNPDYSSSTVASVTEGVEVAYVRVNDLVIWGNGLQTGYIRQGVNYSWVRPASRPAPPYSDEHTIAEYSDPPLGQMFEIYNGRVYVISGNAAYASEFMQYSYFRPGVNRMVFPHNITMFKAIDGGIFISTDHPGETWFAQGETLHTLQRVSLEEWTSPAIKGSAQLVDTFKVTDGKVSGKGVMWASPHGICLGVRGGMVLDLTRHKLVYPSSDLSCSYYSDGVYRLFLQA